MICGLFSSGFRNLPKSKTRGLTPIQVLEVFQVLKPGKTQHRGHPRQSDFAVFASFEIWKNPKPESLQAWAARADFAVSASSLSTFSITYSFLTLLRASRARSEKLGARGARSEAAEERGARRARSEERGEGGARSEASEGGVRSEGRGSFSGSCLPS